MNKVNLEELSKFIENSERGLVMFSTEWCGECKMNFPLIEKFEAEHSNTKFVKIDVDEAKLWQEDNNENYKVKSVPTYHLYENGQLVNEFEGFINPQKLKEILG